MKLRPSLKWPIQTVRSKTAHSRSLSPSGAFHSRISGDNSERLAYYRERRERAQGLKHGGRRGPGEWVLRGSFQSRFCTTSPGPARLCVPGLLSPSSPEGGLSWRLFMGYHGFKLSLGNRAPSEFCLRPWDVFLFEARLKASYSLCWLLLFFWISSSSAGWEWLSLPASRILIAW